MLDARGAGAGAPDVRAATDAVYAALDAHRWSDALVQALDLVQTPHALDTRPGSTLSAGLDALEAGAQRVCEARPPIDTRVWPLAHARLTAALQLTHTSTVNRARRALLALLDVAPPAWSEALFADALAEPDTQASLVLAEALVTHGGTAVVASHGVRPFFAALLDAMQAGRGSVSRRSRLAIALVSACRAERQPLDVWLPCVAHTLVHAEDRGAENVVAHFVHPLLDAWPGVLRALLDALGDAAEAAEAPDAVRALLAVLRAAKMRELCVLVDDASDAPDTPDTPEAPDAPDADARVRVPCAVLHTCIASAAPRLQVAALALTVESKTPAALFEPAELDVVRAFFTASLTLPSAVARKDSIALFVKLLVRMRVGMHALQKQTPPPPRLAAMHALLRDLFAQVLQATHPGAPYACTILSVSLLFLLLEASLALPSPGAELAQFPLQDAVRALHKAKQTYPGHAPFPGVAPSAALTQRLLVLASENTYDDIQQAATLLLLRLARVPDAGLHDPVFVRTHIVVPSLARLGALKDSDAYAAVQLLRLYHACTAAEDADAVLAHVEDAAYAVHPHAHAARPPPPLLPPPPPGAWTARLLHTHLALLDARLAYAETHGVAAASHAHALHGTLAGVHLLVAHAPDAVDDAALDVLDACVRRTWSLAAPVLCAAAPEGGAGGDRDEGDAESDAESDAEPAPEPAPELHHAMRLADTLDTPAYQRILSYAWRAIKEAAALYATVLGARPAERVRDADLFLEWLLRIRHRGAFSTVYPQYERVARTLLQRHTAAPTAWLEQLLARLDAHAEQLSTTRRSAGIGYAVLALLGAHGRDAAPLVTRTVADLVRMSQNAHPVRTIHALNVLRVLVLDSGLAPAMRAHLGAALARAVACFCSPHWGVRNASMMLCSAICTRYYGIHALADVGASTRPLDALLDASPALGDALVHTLATESQRVGAADLAAVGHGSALYTVLLLLSTVRDAHGHALPHAALCAHVERCTASANGAIRAQAAACLAALLPRDEHASFAARAWRDASLRDQNALHGRLLVLRAVHAHVDLARLDLLQANPCPMTVAAFLAVAHDALRRGDVGRAALAPVAAWVRTLLGAACAREDSHGCPAAMHRLVRDPFLAWALPPALALALDLHALPPIDSLLHASAPADVAGAALRVLSPACTEARARAAALGALGCDAAHLHTCAVDVALAAHAARDVRIAAARLAHALHTAGAACDWHARRAPRCAPPPARARCAWAPRPPRRTATRAPAAPRRAARAAPHPRAPCAAAACSAAPRRRARRRGPRAAPRAAACAAPAHTARAPHSSARRAPRAPAPRAARAQCALQPAGASRRRPRAARRRVHCARAARARRASAACAAPGDSRGPPRRRARADGAPRAPARRRRA